MGGLVKYQSSFGHGTVVIIVSDQISLFLLFSLPVCQIISAILRDFQNVETSPKKNGGLWTHTLMMTKMSSMISEYSKCKIIIGFIICGSRAKRPVWNQENRKLRIEDWGLRIEDWGLRIEDWGLGIVRDGKWGAVRCSEVHEVPPHHRQPYQSKTCFSSWIVNRSSSDILSHSPI